MAHAFLRGPQSQDPHFCKKTCYESLKEARKALGKLRKSNSGLAAMGEGRLGAYRCEWCGSFHIGHLNLNAARKLRAARRLAEARQEALAIPATDEQHESTDCARPDQSPEGP